MLNIFGDDAFGVVPLTDTINNIKFAPGRLGTLGIFTETPIATTAVAIESQDGLLNLIGPTPRGGPGHTLDKGPRTLRSLMVPHFEINDAVMAEEVQNIRAWGTETQLETVQARVAERLALHSNSMEATHEYARIGAVKGIVTYFDGSTLNLYTEFGVTAQTEIDFDLDNATPASGALRTKCASVARLIATELGGAPFQGIHALVGDAFFDNLIAHPEVRETYLGWAAAADLRTGYIDRAGGLVSGVFQFGDIMWENYRGSVGGTTFVDTNKAHFFPVGVPGLFRTYYAPADYVETVNTLGRRLYTKQYEMANGKGVHMDTQMNALDICTRPRALVQGRRT